MDDPVGGLRGTPGVQDHFGAARIGKSDGRDAYQDHTEGKDQANFLHSGRSYAFLISQSLDLLLVPVKTLSLLLYAWKNC